MGIRYEGRYPDADLVLGHKKWTDDTNAALSVTSAFIDSEIARVVTDGNLQTNGYVDAQDSLLAKLTAVQNADAGYLPDTVRNVTVAGLDSSGMLIGSQVPSNIVTDRVTQSYVGAAVFSGTMNATSTTLRERKLASVTIVDPGFAYIPLPFGTVFGGAGGTPPLNPWSGNGVCGLLTVCPPAGSGDTIYGFGGCSDSTTVMSYPILPFASSNTSPGNRPAVTGTLTLDLYGSCFQGSGYTFYSGGLNFFVLAMPAL